MRSVYIYVFKFAYWHHTYYNYHYYCDSRRLLLIIEFKQLANVNSCLFVFAYANQIILSYNIIIIIARDHIVMRGITVKT